MTAETDHHPSGPLVMAVSLAAVAGFIDAHLFLYVTNIFVANMSGNMVRLGIATGETSWATAVGSLSALGAFTFGVVVAIAHHDRRLRAGAAVRPDELLLVEWSLTLLLPLLVLGFDVEFSADPTTVHMVVLMIGAVAMGIQASLLRRVANIAVATTYGTGTIVRIGEKVALALRKAERSSEDRRGVTLAVLIAVLSSYVGGAAIASVLGESPLLLFLPPAVLGVFVSPAGRVRARRTQAVRSLEEERQLP